MAELRGRGVVALPMCSRYHRRSKNSASHCDPLVGPPKRLNDSPIGWIGENQCPKHLPGTRRKSLITTTTQAAVQAVKYRSKTDCLELGQSHSAETVTG